MKSKFILILFLFISVTLVYTACKKDVTTVKTLPAKAVISQLALNLAQTLYGGFGAFNISGGLNSTSTLNVSRQQLALKLTRGRQINDLNGDITCGMSVDTVLNSSFSVGDTSLSISGPIKFTFLCANGIPSGFTVSETLNISESTSQMSDTFLLGENLTLQAVNPADPNSNINFGGTSNFTNTIKDKTVSGQTTGGTYNYTFTSVIIDADGNIVSGSATFSTKGSSAAGAWNYQGSITFLGNNMATITIDRTAYTVNLETGVVS
ncbi:MAG: hypothetical protein ABI203_09265 [Mucilaginibacter sp.]